MGNVTFEQLQQLVLSWADERQILDHGSPLTQAIKTTEEVAELLKALSRHDAKETVDALGDCMVTLIICAELAGYDLKDCLEEAYETIKDRRGYLTPDGIFVKES